MPVSLQPKEAKQSKNISTLQRQSAQQNWCVAIKYSAVYKCSMQHHLKPCKIKSSQVMTLNLLSKCTFQKGTVQIYVAVQLEKHSWCAMLVTHQ